MFTGDYCFIEALNKDGVCTLVSSCPSAVKLLNTQKNLPQICGHKNKIPIICCEIDSTPNITLAPRQTPARAPNIPSVENTTVSSIETTPIINKKSSPCFVTPTSTEIPQIGHKSRQKCQEYAKYVYAVPMFDFVLGRDPPEPISECEIVQIENIVSGTPARLKEFPHMALLGFERNGELHWLCGGSLISENYILSVAHCQDIKDFGAPTHVLLGELTLNSETDGAKPQRIPIARIIPHGEYIPNQHYNDIALYELQYNAVLNPYVRPACLNSNSSRDISLSIASGWGNSSVLDKIVLDLYTNEECNFVYRNGRDDNMRERIREDEHICAESRNLSRDVCLGDSGGPLQIINSDEVYCTHIIVGVVAFGRHCGMRGNPGVYTRVSHYIEWIESIVWP